MIELKFKERLLNFPFFKWKIVIETFLRNYLRQSGQILRYISFSYFAMRSSSQSL